jgi:hypothetical protein
VKNPRLPVPQAATGNQKIFHNNIMPLHASTVNVGENSGFIHKSKDAVPGVLFIVITAFCCSAATVRPPRI